MDPGCQVDHVLILEGEQGLGKTSGFASLGGEWFSDSLPGDLHSKDAAMHLRGNWIIEMPELGQLSKSDVESTKSFLSRRHERFRPPYGRTEEHYPRQCVFGGTTNQRVYFKDETGNRRFWPVRVDRVDLASLQADRDQLWAEAVHAYRAKVPWHLTDDAVIATANEEQSLRREEDVWHERVARHLAYRTEVDSLGTVLKEALDIEPRLQVTSAQARLTRIMNSLGWQKGPRKENCRPWVKINSKYVMA